MSFGETTERQIAAAARALAAGGLVCFPTETMYGIAADIRRADALDRLVELKGRDATAPFGLIVAHRDDAEALAAVWPDAAAELADEHWPGPLTLVVPARADLPPCVVGPGGGVGLRQSSHPWAAALASELGGPITATSANPSGQPAAMNIAQARAYFGDAIDVYLDAGPASQHIPSTVIDVSTTGELRVLRAGAVDIDPSGT